MEVERDSWPSPPPSFLWLFKERFRLPEIFLLVEQLIHLFNNIASEKKRQRFCSVVQREISSQSTVPRRRLFQS